MKYFLTIEYIIIGIYLIFILIKFFYKNRELNMESEKMSEKLLMNREINKQIRDKRKKTREEFEKNWLIKHREMKANNEVIE
jgi:hypothetical protein